MDRFGHDVSRGSSDLVRVLFDLPIGTLQCQRDVDPTGWYTAPAEIPFENSPLTAVL